MRLRIVKTANTTQYAIIKDINKNGKKPTSVDLLLIQRHILGLQMIQQGG